VAGAGVCAPAAVAKPSPGNLLLNGDFESADAKGLPENWVMTNTTGNKMVKASLDSKAFSGKKCLALEGQTFPVMFGVFSKPVDVSNLTTTTLMFNCYYRTEDAPQADVSITTFNTDFSQNEWKTPPMQTEARPVPQSKDWSLMSWQFHCQPGAKQVVVMFRVTGKGTAFFDGASLRTYPSEIVCTVHDPGQITNLPDHRTITLDLANTGPERRKIRIVALAQVEGKKPVRAETGADIDPNAKGAVSLEYRYDARKAHQLQIIVMGENPVDIFDHRNLEVPGLVAGRLLSPAFRATVLSTIPSPNVEAEGYINAPPEMVRAMTFEARLMGTGQRAAAGSKEFQVTPEGRWHVSFPIIGMLSDSFAVRVSAKLSDHEGWVDLPLRKAPSGTNECGYDDHLRLWVSGKAVFPIGIYNALKVEDLPKVSAAGFNFIINPSRALSYDHADQCEKLGLGFVLSSPTLESAFWKNMTDKYGRSPCLIGWYGVERPDSHLTAATTMRDLYNRMMAGTPPKDPPIDTHHPLLEAVASPSQYADYFSAADIPLVWTDIIPTAPLSVIGSSMDTAVAATRGRKPVWAVIQATGRGYTVSRELDPANEGRTPTPAEYRAMVYEALIHGANGIVAYAYTIPQDSKHRGYQIDVDAKGLWEQIKTTNSELAWLGPVFANGQRTALPPAAGGVVDMATWSGQAGKYLVAVNTSPTATVSVFNVPGCSATKLNVLFESRFITGPGQGAFADSFDPQQVHVYCWK
jgi:hypothetical protein